MKVGDIVVCIDTILENSFWIEHLNNLTKNKRYKIIAIHSDFSFIVVMTDFGEKRSFASFRFITLDEFRDKKLKELGI